MKRTLLLCLVFCIILTAFCGCEQEPTYTVQSDDPIESYDNESRIVLDGSDTGEASKHIPAEGDFVVKGKKYVYQLLDLLPAEEVLILNVSNKTDTNYEVTMHITYLDEKGAVLKEEAQTYQDIAAGNSTYFVFRPQISFADYSYALSVKEHEGPCYLSNLVPYEWDAEEAEKQVWKAHVPELLEQEDYTMYHHLTTKIPYKNENDIFIYAMIHIVVFDNRGEIAFLGATGDMLNAREMIRTDATLCFTLDDITANPKSWPEHLQGDLQAMIIPSRALTKEEAEQLIGRPLG